LHCLPLGLVLPKVPKELPLIRIVVLADPFRAAFQEALYVVLLDSQPQIVESCIVSVVEAYGSSACEALSPSPPTPLFPTTVRGYLG
jgi:hypothetical protein